MQDTSTDSLWTRHHTVSFEEERQVWRDALPELAALLGQMPERKGRIRLFFAGVPESKGDLIATVTLTDQREEGPEWWWSEVAIIHQPRGDTLQRAARAQAKLDGMRAARAKVTRTRQRGYPNGGSGGNVVPFGWYKALFEEEGR